jgi:hypothetical protein
MEAVQFPGIGQPVFEGHEVPSGGLSLALLSCVGRVAGFWGLLVIEVPSQNEVIRDEVCLAHFLLELSAVRGEGGRINVDDGKRTLARRL